MRSISCNVARRTFFSSAKPAKQVQLSEAYPSSYPSVPASPSSAFSITTLPNGIKVASVSNGGSISTVGLAVLSGSRNETDASRGCSHMVEHTAFKSTGLSSHQRFVRDLETIGARVTPYSGREVSTFKVVSTTHSISSALPLLADGVLNARHAAWELEEYSEVVQHAAANLKGNNNYTMKDLAHGAAFYPDSPLGQSAVYTEGYSDISTPVIKEHFASHFTPARSTVIGVNIGHSDLVKFAESLSSHFASGSSKPVDTASPYVGGEVRVQTHGASNANVSVGFSTGGFKGSNEAALEVLKELLKSSGNAQFNNYSDAGVFYVHKATSDPKSFISSVISGLKDVSKGPSADAFAAAKAAAKVAVLESADTSSGLFDSIAYQVSRTGKYVDKSVSISNVTADDVKAAASSLLKSKLSLASKGKTSIVPRISEVHV